MKNEKPKKSAPLFTLILITFTPNQHIKHTFSDLA